MNKSDQLCQRIVTRIIADIEAGVDEWEMPWHRLAVSGTPRSVDGHLYRGVNAMILPMEASDRGYTSSVWGTYRAWGRNNGQVRRGEKSTQIVFWKRATARDEDAEGDEALRTFWVARAYNVFNAHQVDGAEHLVNDEVPEIEAADVEDHELYFKHVGADVRVGGNRAFYAPVEDYIGVPKIEQFVDPERYYSTLAHEHVHWTGHESRLDRDLKLRFGDDAYAAEELVAELGAAMWCAQAKASPAPRQDHAAYVQHWLRVLREHPRHLLTVSNRAQAALDYLNSFQPTEEDQ